MKRTSLKKLNEGLRITAEQYSALAGSTEQQLYTMVKGGTHYVKDVRAISGIKKAWNKAQKFILVLNANLAAPHYLDAKGNLTTKQSEARKFAFGFDVPAVKETEWYRKTKLDFKHMTYYGTRKEQ